MHHHAPLAWLAPLAFAGANAAGGVFAYLTGHIDITAVAAGVTAVSLALLGAVKILTPAVADAVKTIGPALAELQKQREEIRKGSLSEQIAASLANQQKMRESLHAVNNQLNVKGLEAQALAEDLLAAHRDSASLSAQLAETNRQLVSANRRIGELMADVQRLSREERTRGRRAESLLTEVRDSIRQQGSDSGLMPVVESPPPPPPPVS